MLVAAFKSLWTQLVVIGVLAGVCSLVVWRFDGRQAAIELIDIGVARMKGPWVWIFGYGLASFVRNRGRLLPACLNGVLVASASTATATARIERSTFHRNAWRYSMPITLLGAFLTAVYGIPAQGLVWFILFVGVCSIYYVAGYLLHHFIEVTLAFHELFESMDTVEFKRAYSPLYLENLTTYLAITTTLGLIGIYAGFRGTLTAGFVFHEDVWRTFLSTPLVLFLPGTLFL